MVEQHFCKVKVLGSNPRGGSTTFMQYKHSSYFHVGRSSELANKRDRRLYRALEIFPGFLAWMTIALTFVLSFFFPFYVALFIIAFDTFWLAKTIYISIYLYICFRKVRESMDMDWSKMIAPLKYEHIYHMIILPFYSEGIDVVEGSIRSILATEWDPKKLIIVLASEERAGADAQEIGAKMSKKYSSSFGHFLVTVHPKDIAGELAGKGANITHASIEVRKKILDPNNIPYEDVMVSAFDIDTVVYPKYFQCLTWHFLTSPRPFRTSFQPIPFYNNNIWHVPGVSRIADTSGSFWQMVQQERPEKLVTFSSHAVSFQTLHDIGYWQKNIVSDDSRIFWNAFMAYGGDYTVTPIFYPISMDANLGSSFFQTLKNIYKQHRRWMWGAENIPYILFSFIKNKDIPLRKKIRTAFVQVDGYWSGATNPIFILLLGWLPILLGGHAFNQTVLSYSLPVTTRNLMIIGMLGLVFQAAIASSFLPSPPKGYKRLGMRKAIMFLQWFFIPLTIIIFGAIPGLDAQTRLMFGRYMGFWVTPKHRKE